jgi:adenosylcobyric acid synthase
MEGLGLLPVTTVLTGGKSTHRVRARALRAVPFMGLDPLSGDLTAYEIHMGSTRGEGEAPLLIEERDGREIRIADGAVHERLHVFGSYLHGIFENPAVREGFLNHLRRARGFPPLAAERDWEEWREERLERLARITRASLEMSLVYSLLGR